jgi:hypothetical protein
LWIPLSGAGQLDDVKQKSAFVGAAVLERRLPIQAQAMMIASP